MYSFYNIFTDIIILYVLCTFMYFSTIEFDSTINLKIISYHICMFKQVYYIHYMFKLYKYINKQVVFIEDKHLEITDLRLIETFK